MKRADEVRAVYRVEGERVPSVTTILGVINKPALVRWANRLGLQGIDSGEYVDALAGIGTLAHRMIQEYLGGEAWNRRAYTPAEVEAAESAALHFLAWERRGGHCLETVAIEKPFVSRSYFYGGTVDWYGRIDGKPWLVDIKTGRSLFPEHTYQAAAYRQLLRENGHEVEGVRLLRVGRSDREGFDDRVLSGAALDAAWEVFLTARNLYMAKRNFERAA